MSSIHRSGDGVRNASLSQAQFANPVQIVQDEPFLPPQQNSRIAIGSSNIKIHENNVMNSRENYYGFEN